MHGIGELFGSAFDDVLRRPTPALVPFVVDVALLLAGALVFSAAIGVPVFSHAPQGLPDMPFTVPESLPSVTDVRDATGVVLADRDPRAWLAVGALVAVAVPVAAYARGGFIGVLLEAYMRRDDVTVDPDAQSLDALVASFHAHGSRSFGPLLLLGLLDVVVALAAVLLPQLVPRFGNTFLGIVTFRFLFLFAPYMVVVEGCGALAALRRSVRTVSDYLATVLVALLFGLLTTGGVAAVLRQLVDVVGDTAVLVGAVVYAPIGTVLALFYLKVYLSLRPSERFPAAVGEAPAASSMPSEA